MEELKDNYCGIMFVCDENRDLKNCLYRVNKKQCKYLKVNHYCTSAVANVNRMILHAKHIGMELTAKGFKNE